MTLAKPFNRGSRYFYLFIAATCILYPSCSSRYLLKTPHRIENYELNFTKRGIEPSDQANISQKEWWESFYQRIVDIKASDLGHYSQFERNSQINSVVQLIETGGEQFSNNKLGIIKYLSFGNNSETIANISYFRVFRNHSLSVSKRVELLIEKGVDATWEDVNERMGTSDNLNEESQNRSTPWILYRFLISKGIDDQRGLFNRAFLLSCDKYYCLTNIDGTRRVLLAQGKNRYLDLITPESEGYAIIEKIFKKAVDDYCANYQC